MVNNHQEEKIMNKNDYMIRLEAPADHAEVENLVRESFWNVYRPGCYEHYLLRCLRKDNDFVPEMDFVMEKDARIIGQNIYMRAKIKTDAGTKSLSFRRQRSR